MSDSFYKSEMDREMLLNIEIQKQNLKALPQKFKPQKKAISPVTQQMIDDYKQQFRNMYERKGEDGKKQFYKFLIPEALPTLEIIDDDLIDVLTKKGDLQPILNYDDIIEINEELDNAIINYKDQEQGLNDQYRIIDESKKRINELTATRLDLYMQENTDLKDIEDLDRRIEKNLERIRLSEDAIIEVNIRLPNIQTKINELKKELEENEENKIKNENVLYTIEQNNKKKLADYAKTLRIMNEGQINVEQAEGESESDFLKRLADVALIEEDLTRAGLYNTNEFKKNLKTIIKSEWKIENLVKSFNNDNQFLLNKTFAGFKKYFNEVYGAGNQNLEVEDYIALINAYLDSEAPRLIKGKTKLESKGEKEEETNEESNEETKAVDLSEEALDDIYGDTAAMAVDLPEVEARAIPPPPPPISARILQDIKISKDGDVLRFENTANNNNLYFKLEDPEKKKGDPSKIVKYSNDNITYVDIGKGPAFNGKLNTQIKSLGLSDTNSDFKVIRYMIGGDKLIISVTDFINFFNSYKEGSGFKKSKKLKKPKKQLVVQKGASIKDVPNKCEFGKLIILLNKLYHNNILSVKDKNGINVQGIPNSQVGDKFVNIILSMCNDEEVNKKDIDALSEKDFILFNVLIKKAGLTKKYNIDNTKTIKTLKDRLTLVEGEIVAGNDNEELKKELYDVVFKLANVGAISISSARKYYKDTLKLYFKK